MTNVNQENSSKSDLEKIIKNEEMMLLENDNLTNQIEQKMLQLENINNSNYQAQYELEKMEHELKVWEGITAKLNSKDEQAKVLLQNCQNEYSDICTKGYLQTKTEISNASENLKHSKDFEVEKLAEKVHELVEITKQDYESEFNQKIADLNPKLETALRTLAESEKRMNKTNEKYALQNPTLISISEWQGYIRELEEEIRDIRDKISQSNAMDLNE